MTEFQASVGDFDFLGAPDRPASGDPFAILLAGLQLKRAAAPPLDLRAIVERQVVPHLHGLHRNDLHQAPPQPILPGVSALEDEVTALCDRLLANDHAGACGRIDALRIEGRSLECIYLHLLTPAASHLRRLWSEDLCGFAEATLALLNLQSVLRHFAPAFRTELGTTDTGHRALLAAPHRTGVDVAAAMVGLVVVSEFFRRGGWESWIEPDLSSPTFDDTVRQQWFDVIELLVASDRQLDTIASSIRSIRRGAPNRSVGVIVCGQIFIDHPEFVRMVGADLNAVDPRAGLLQANQFVSLPTPQARLR